MVHAPILLQCFASDRSHMKDSLENWISPPPVYKPIVAEGAFLHLQFFLKLDIFLFVMVFCSYHSLWSDVKSD